MRSSTLTLRSAAAALVCLLGGAAAPAFASDLVFATAESGYQALRLRTFEAGSEDRLTVGFVPSRAAGPAFATGLGLRLGAFTLGVRGGLARFEDPSLMRSVGSYQLWSLAGELGARIALARVEPYFVLGGGYSAFGGLDDAVEGLGAGLDVDGVNLRGGVGCDVRLTRWLTLGARGTGELLFLGRPGMPVRELATPKEVDTLGETRARLLEADGASMGTAWSITGVLGVDL
jgi:hypothetical protein